MTPHAWCERVTSVFDVLTSYGKRPFVVAMGRTPDAFGSSCTIAVLDDVGLVHDDSLAALVSDSGPVDLVGIGWPVTLTDTSTGHSQPSVQMIVASLHDTDSVTLTLRDGDWQTLYTTEEVGAITVLRCRLWDLLIRSQMKEGTHV